MNKKELKCWKKVFQDDLSYVVKELREILDYKSVVLVEGALGAGKTSLVQSFIFSDNAKEATSPTYSVINEYPGVAHADFYRLNSDEEILHLELDYVLEDKDYFFVEWGQKHLSRIVSEVSEDFSFYLVEIALSKAGSQDARDYSLFSIQEY